MLSISCFEEIGHPLIWQVVIFEPLRRQVYGPRLFHGCRLGLSRAACRERPHVAIPRETDHVHLAGSSRARPFGDAPRAGVLRKNGRDRVRQPQNLARVVANATRRFGRDTLAPDGGVERVAELALECQRDASRRLFAPEPSSCESRARVPRIRKRGPSSRSAR